MPFSSSPAPLIPILQPPLSLAFRVAIAAAITLFVAECLHLKYANMAVWTTHMVMAKFDFTIFQRGFERVIGRAAGVFIGWVLLAAFPDAWAIRAFLEVLCVTAFFYCYFAQRLAYTFLNAGIFLIAVIGIGNENPAAAYVEGQEILFAIVLGVAIADLVIWLGRTESNVHIQLGTEPLLPVRFEWLNHSMMLTASAFTSVMLTRLIGLPTEQAVVSVFIMAVAPDIQQNLRKGELRLLGALMALLWGLVTFLVVGRIPYLLVFMGVLFFGMLIAAYLARASDKYGYAGLQMGLVLPMLVVVPLNELGHIDIVIQRMEGVAAAIVSTLVVGGLWPPFYRSAVAK